MDLLDELTEVLSDPRLRHPALVHLPVAGALLWPPLMVAWARARRSRVLLARCCLALGATIVLSAWLAASAGEAARGLLGALPDGTAERLAAHRTLARQLWWLAALPTLAVALTGDVRWPGPALGLAPAPRSGLRRRRLCVALALAGAVLLAGATGLAAHHGGLLVHHPTTGLVHRPRPGGDRTSPEPLAPPARDAVPTAALSLLESRCLGCHGAGPAPGGGLRLDSRERALAGGARGPALVPGDAAASLLHQVVSGRHPELSMPLQGRPLTLAEQRTLAAWIDAGAAWPEQP